MTKISEAIMYYESIKPKTDFDAYFGDSHASSKIQTLSLIKEALGDVEISDDHLKAYIYGLRSFPFKTPYERELQEVRIIYELAKDTQMTAKDLITLIDHYDVGAYKLMSKRIKELISTREDIGMDLRVLVKEAMEYSIKEAAKLDYLKEEYSKKFIERIQKRIKDECLSAEEVFKIIPSKSFIEASEVEIPGFGYTILSGEDIVTKRLYFIDIEEDYQKALPDERVRLGYSSYGDTIYTSFTKAEYEEDLKTKKKIKII